MNVPNDQLDRWRVFADLAQKTALSAPTETRENASGPSGE